MLNQLSQHQQFPSDDEYTATSILSIPSVNFLGPVIFNG